MSERAETYALATIGLARGIWEVYIKPEPAKLGWLAVGLGVLAIERCLPETQTLTAEAQKHKVMTAVGVAVTGAHLLGKLPERIDPFVISNNRMRR